MNLVSTMDQERISQPTGRDIALRLRSLECWGCRLKSLPPIEFCEFWVETGRHYCTLSLSLRVTRFGCRGKLDKDLAWCRFSFSHDTSTGWCGAPQDIVYA